MKKTLMKVVVARYLENQDQNNTKFTSSIRNILTTLLVGRHTIFPVNLPKRKMKKYKVRDRFVMG